jgi:hypothetical protein
LLGKSGSARQWRTRSCDRPCLAAHRRRVVIPAGSLPSGCSGEVGCPFAGPRDRLLRQLRPPVRHDGARVAARAGAAPEPSVPARLLGGKTGGNVVPARSLRTASAPASPQRAPEMSGRAPVR